MQPVGRVQVHAADEEGRPGQGLRQRPHDREQVQEPPYQRRDDRGGRRQDPLPLLRHGASDSIQILSLRTLQDAELREETEC